MFFFATVVNHSQGFLVLHDVLQYKFNVNKYNVHVPCTMYIKYNVKQIKHLIGRYVDPVDFPPIRIQPKFLKSKDPTFLISGYI